MSSLLTTYNLLHTVHFATRTLNKSSTATDNIFVANSRPESSYTSPIINGLSDHDSQFLITCINEQNSKKSKEKD